MNPVVLHLRNAVGGLVFPVLIEHGHLASNDVNGLRPGYRETLGMLVVAEGIDVTFQR